MRKRVRRWTGAAAALLFASVAAAQDGLTPWATVTVPDGGELHVRQPIPDTIDYPLAAKQSDIQGTTLMRLTIAPDGNLADCTVIGSAGHPDLDARACALYRERARFRITGRTAPIVTNARMRWVLLG